MCNQLRDNTWGDEIVLSVVSCYVRFEDGHHLTKVIEKTPNQAL